MTGEGGVMALQEAYDFYSDAMRTYAPTYENRLTVESSSTSSLTTLLTRSISSRQPLC